MVCLRIIAAAHTVEEFGGIAFLSGTQFAFGQRVDDLGQTYLGVVALPLNEHAIICTKALHLLMLTHTVENYCDILKKKKKSMRVSIGSPVL